MWLSIAHSLQHIPQFLTELERAEKKVPKRIALAQCHLSDLEWARVNILITILSVSLRY